MRVVSILIRFALGLVVGVLALPWCLDRLQEVIRQHQHWPQDPWAVGGGAVVGVLALFIGRPSWMLHTLIHELCHAILCWCTGVKVRSFQISDGDGGFVKHDEPGAVRGLFILIAPYTLPLLLAPALVARMWQHYPGSWRVGLSALCAVLFVTHVVGLVRNIRINFWPNDGDLAKVGRFLALVLISCTLILVTTWTIDVLWSR